MGVSWPIPCFRGRAKISARTAVATALVVIAPDLSHARSTRLTIVPTLSLTLSSWLLDSGSLLITDY
jgi:hypothetical protein